MLRTYYVEHLLQLTLAYDKNNITYLTAVSCARLTSVSTDSESIRSCTQLPHLTVGSPEPLRTTVVTLLLHFYYTVVALAIPRPFVLLDHIPST
jgi:hypothetical protein